MSIKRTHELDVNNQRRMERSSAAARVEETFKPMLMSKSLQMFSASNTSFRSGKEYHEMLKSRSAQKKS